MYMRKSKSYASQDDLLELQNEVIADVGEDFIASSGYEAADVGKVLMITEGGVVTPETSAQVQADWEEADDAAPDYIKNKPTIPSGDDLVPSISGVTNGQVLTKVESGTSWADPLPSTAAASAGNVLTLDSNKVPGWAAPSGGGGATTTHYTTNATLVAAMIALDVGAEISLYGSYVQNPGGQYEAEKTFYVSRAHKIASDDYLASGGYKGTSWTGVYELQTNASTNGLGFIEASGGSDWMNDNYHPGSVDVYLTVYQ